MAPEDRKDRTDISIGAMLTRCPKEATALCSSCVNIVVEMAIQEAEKKVYRGVDGGAWWPRECLMRERQAVTGQKVAVPEQPSPMRSPRTPFF